jgi:hypothetical protein
MKSSPETSNLSCRTFVAGDVGRNELRLLQLPLPGGNVRYRRFASGIAPQEDISTCKQETHKS